MMNPLQAVILGIIQGLTEFLPVSSSGHLVLFQHLFGLEEPELFFNISVHMGTLAAVIIFFWQEIRSVLTSVIRFPGMLSRKEVTLGHIWEDEELRLAALIIIGSVPTAIIGLLFHRVAERLFSSVFLVGCALILTGILLLLTRWLPKDGKEIREFSIVDALVIGVMQGLAIIPGISRSGSTIATGLFLGLDKETAARYSFLLSIPAIVGAEILSLKDVSFQAFDIVTLLGTLTAGVVGYGALTLLLYILKRGQLHFFVPYCWLVGVAAITLGG